MIAVRNEITHDKPAPPVEASRRFLSGYIDSILCIKQHPKADILKGKMVISRAQSRMEELRPAREACTSPPETWQKPTDGWAKLNVDGAYLQASDTGGAGMILRDSNGPTIFASCRYLRTCTSPLEAELAAIKEGIELTLEWSTLSFIIESGCANAVAAIKNPSL